MDVVALLRRASHAQLEVVVVGGRLVVRGPRRSEALAQRILASRDEVMRVLVARRGEEGPPPAPTVFERTWTIRSEEFAPNDSDRCAPWHRCYCCGSPEWWRLEGSGFWVCLLCHPPLADDFDVRHVGEDQARLFPDDGPDPMEGH